MEQGIIYVATNRINGKQYVGQTRFSIKKRMAEHVKDAKHDKSSIFHKAISKYGINNFIIETYEFPVDQLNFQEQKLIAQLQTMHTGYNLTEGGGGCNGFKHSPESKLKMATMKGKHFTPEHKAKLAASKLGIPRDEATKQKISTSKTGKKIKPFTDEHKNNLSKSVRNANFKSFHRYNVVTPAGEKIILNGRLKQFCEANGLSRRCVQFVLSKKYKHHRGWYFEYAD